MDRIERLERRDMGKPPDTAPTQRYADSGLFHGVQTELRKPTTQFLR